MNETRLFSALLRHHRNARGMTQLDLASSAELSARHLSFLETGRARPSREMVLRVASALALSLRDQNALLSAAGFRELFGESQLEQLPPTVRAVLERMLAVHEPYPVLVLDGAYELRMHNRGAAALFELVLSKEQRALHSNILTLCFDPLALRPYIDDWERLARRLLGRVAREHMQSGRESLRELLSKLLAYPGVPSDFRTIDPSLDVEPAFELHVRYQGQRFGFLAAVTTFIAARDVTLEELRIESYYPLDDATERFCRALANAQPTTS